ncbi:MAG: hypothetical protein QM690_16015 [Sphingobium sp.]
MSETIYDKLIAPRLHEIMMLCHAHGLPLVATVEYAPGEFGTTANLPPRHGISMGWMHAAAHSHGNADALILHMMKQARERGHSSMCLRQLGVPFFPAEAARRKADRGTADV